MEQTPPCPTRFVVGRGGPPEPLQARIVGLPAVDVRGQNRTRRRFPLRIRGHTLGAAVAIVNLELQPQREPLAIHVALAIEAQMAAVPSIAQDRPDGVVAGTE